MSADEPAAGVKGGPWSCRVCGDVFGIEGYRNLHLGRAHGDILTPAEVTAFDAALADEHAWLERYRRHVRGGLFTLPAAFLGLFVALVVLVAGAPPIFTLVSAPLMAVLASFFYVMGYVYDPEEGSVSDLRQSRPPDGSA